MTTNERHQVRPWLRVVSGFVGLVLAGAATLLTVAFLSAGPLHADDLAGVAVLALFLGLALLFLAVGLVGRTPSWLPVHERGLGRSMLHVFSLVAALLIFDALRDWLRTHLGMSDGVSRFLSAVFVAGFLVAMAVLQGLADRAKKRRAESTRPAA